MTDNQQDEYWARPVERLAVDHTPPGSINLNLDGRRLTSPLQGFGPLVEKRYTLRLMGVKDTPVEIMRAWQANFAGFHPKDVHFHIPEGGVRAGAVMPIDFMLPALPGLPEIFPMASGVSIIYADETSFTVMAPEGFPIAGWNTFRVLEDQDCSIAQVYSLIRTMDPVYEFGYRFMGGSKKQENDWITVLTNLARYYGVDEPVQVQTTCLDPAYQWREARNVWMNAAIRTFFYRLTMPFRRMRRKAGKR